MLILNGLLKGKGNIWIFKSKLSIFCFGKTVSTAVDISILICELFGLCFVFVVWSRLAFYASLEYGTLDIWKNYSQKNKF